MSFHELAQLNRYYSRGPEDDPDEIFYEKNTLEVDERLERRIAELRGDGETVNIDSEKWELVARMREESMKKQEDAEYDRD